jgi:hypothetical protein
VCVGRERVPPSGSGTATGTLVLEQCPVHDGWIPGRRWLTRWFRYQLDAPGQHCLRLIHRAYAPETSVRIRLVSRSGTATCRARRCWARQRKRGSHRHRPDHMCR